MSEIVIRRAEPRETQRLFNFWQRELTGGARVCELFQWREQGGTASGGNTPYVAEHRGDIVGASNSVRLTVGRRGCQVSAVWQIDVVVAPQMRGRGIVKQLMEQLAGATLSLGRGTAPAMYAIKKKIGFQDAPNTSFLACPLTPFYPASSLRRRVKYALAYSSSRCHWWDSTVPPGLRLSEECEFGPEFDRLAEKLVSGEALTPWKPGSYLRWRYCGCPGRTYRTLRLDGPEGLRGAVVFRGPEGPERNAWIVDLLADPADAATISALIHGVQHELKAIQASVVWMSATSQRVRTQLRKAGFLDTARSLRFTYLAYGKLPFDPIEADWNFYYADGDCELYSDRYYNHADISFEDRSPGLGLEQLAHRLGTGVDDQSAERQQIPPAEAWRD